jgi:hypothetical protein
MTLPDEAKIGPLDPWRRLAVLALAAAAVGLPINHLFGYALLVISAIFVFSGEVTARRKTWLIAVSVMTVAVAGQILLSPPRVEEGHNVFLGGEGASALKTGLPAEAFGFMAAQFDAQYPPERRCDAKIRGCWRGGGFPDRPFAFSADGIFDHPQYSRRVSGIDFSDPVWLRLGFINDLRYNWYAGISDIQRVSRDGRFWMGLHRWHLTMPWYVMYQFPREYVGGSLCWQGTVLWETDAQHFAPLQHLALACRTLELNDAGRRIFGIAIQPDTLAMTLKPPLQIRIRQWAGSALMLASVITTLVLLIRWRWRKIVLPLAFVASALLVIAVDDGSFIGGLRPFDGGDDGLFYEGIGRLIVQHLLQGDIARALEGGEKVFYYGGPGFRYFRAVEQFIFGDTNLGYLSLILLLPFAVFAAFRRFLPPLWALALIAIFIAVPVGTLFGTSFVLYAKWAARGFADPAAFTLFLCGFVFILGPAAANPPNRFTAAFGGALLLALAVIVKPNIAPVTGVLLGAAGLEALFHRRWRRLAGMCIGFVPVLGMALHNWVFGGVFVPFSSNATIAELLVMPPMAWIDGLLELLRLDFTGGHALRAGTQLTQWLSGPAESWLLIPVHLAAIAILVRVALWERRFDPWIRVVAAGTLLQHAVSLCYLLAPRYFFLAWLLTLLVTVVWIREAGIPLLRKYVPDWCDKVAVHPTSTRIVAALRRLQHVTETAG